MNSQPAQEDAAIRVMYEVWIKELHREEWDVLDGLIIDELLDVKFAPSESKWIDPVIDGGAKA